MGVFLGQSTRILDRETGKISYGYVPPGSVVVSGSIPSKDGSHSLYCAVIVKTVDEKTNDDFLVLTNGSQYKGDAGDRHYTVSEFETSAIRLKQRSAEGLRLPTRAVPTFSLLEMGLPRTTAEFHWRFSKIAMLPILMLFALCFSSITYRKARFPGMLTALLIYFTYTNIMGLGVAMIRREVVHPHLTLWAINAAFLALALYLFSRRKQNLRLIPGLKA